MVGQDNHHWSRVANQIPSPTVVSIRHQQLLEVLLFVLPVAAVHLLSTPLSCIVRGSQKSSEVTFPPPFNGGRRHIW